MTIPSAIRALIGTVLLAGWALAQMQPSPISEFPIPTYQSGPFSITAGPDGALWFTEEAGKIGRITPDGVISEFTIPVRSISPAGIVAGPDGALWFSEGPHAAIGRMTTGGVYSEFPIPYAGTFTLTVGPDGALWFPDPYGPSVARMTTSGDITQFSLPSVSRFDDATAITTGPDGALWLVETQYLPNGGGFTNVIVRITTAGVATEYSLPQIAISVTSIVAGPDGAVWFAGENGFIGRIAPDGTMTQYLLPTYLAQALMPPTNDVFGALTTGGDGALWFAGPFYVGRLTTSGSFDAYPIPSSTGVSTVGGLTAGPDGNEWFICGDFCNAIGRISISSGKPLQITSAPGLPPGTANAPYVQTLFALGGSWPLTWSVSSGTLPPGLSITGGAVTGTPTTPGAYIFTLQVTDANSASTTQTFSLSVGPAGCFYTISPGGEIFRAAGGSGSIAVSAPAGCAWTVLNVPSGVTIAGATSGSGSGTLTYSVAPNGLATPYDSALSIAGYSFAIEQAPAIPPAGPGFLQSLNFVGSMPDVAAQGGWSTIFTLVNKGTQSADVRTSLFAPDGTPLALPFALPQTQTGPLAASTFDQTLAPNASAVMQAFGPYSAPELAGAAQLAATASVDGFAIFHFDPSEQEAVVPIETRNSPSYLLAFDNTNGVVTGVAIENVSSQAANIAVVIRDDAGALLGSNSIALNPLGQTSFVLSVQFASTANIRGTVEFQTPTGGQISVLGIRYTGTTLTTIPVLANVGAGGGQMAHLAVNDGWQTTFALVNTGGSSASATLNFFDDNGNPAPLPLTFPQGAPPQTVSTLTQTIGPGASLWVQSAGALAAALQTGSAQLITNGNVSGYAIFRFNVNGQEAVVPIESRDAKSYVVPFDNTNGIATGIALSAVSAAPVNVPYAVHDRSGNIIATGTITLAANGHTSFLLSAEVVATAGIGGSVEFDAPPSATISVLGIRTPPALTFTTLPALAK